jgi:hypothetical protein
MTFVLARPRQVFRPTILCAAVLAAGAAAPGGTALAQGKLEARYAASLAGIPLGKGTWIVDIGESHYTTAASGATSGLLKVFTSGQGTGTARGVFSPAGQPVASSYAATVKLDKKTDEVRILVNGGVVKEFQVDPPVIADPERIPVTDAEKRGVMDPMTASLLRAPGNGNPMVPEACQRTLSIFDGRMRYDLKMSFKRMENVKADKGYQGPVVVCAVHFAPIAGFIPSRAAIKYLTDVREAESWLAPVAGTRVLVPFRVQVPTPLGLVVLEATHFVSAPQTARAAAPTKTQ